MMYGSSTKTTFYDIGGGDKIRGIWSSYYHDVHGVIYVIDASTMNEKKYEKSLKVAKEELGHNYLEGKPLLVFCNKFDEPSAACRQIEHIQQDMNLIIREGGRVMIKGVSLHPKNQDGEVDPTIDDSLEWLITTVLSDWDDLRERVSLEMKENDDSRHHKQVRL